jgi:Ca2+-transporting ATPase
MDDLMQSDGRPQRGLTASEVENRRNRYGLNELPQAAGVSPFRVLLRQFTNILVLILIAAAVIAFFLGEKVDTIAIALVVLLNATLGFVQEWRAEKAVEALRDMMSPQARVLRDGTEITIDARELVPDDIVIVDTGVSIPADMEILTAVQLKIDESALTGESLPVAKLAGPDSAGLLAGTSVVNGRAEGKVTATGASTAFGEIAKLTGAVAEKKTNLQRQLGVLASQLGIAALIIAAAILVAGVSYGRDTLEMFMTALSLAVAMVPEGLPAVVTITLALGAAAMVRQKALARRLQAVETLGAASVICTDKTGTLTENKMTATRIWTRDRAYSVTGTGYDPAGHIEFDSQPVRAANDVQLAGLLNCAITCSHARISHKGNQWQTVGEPTEIALVTLAYKGWADIPDPNDLADELPFSSDRKRMSVLSRRGNTPVIYTKGAAEQVLAVSSTVQGRDGKHPLTPVERSAILAAEEEMAALGQRVIALAAREVGGTGLVEQDLVFLGLVGLIDPPRKEVKAAIDGARRAGIRVIMVTGDGPVTAQAIAAQLSIPVQKVLRGDEVEALSRQELSRLLEHDVLFARVKPAHKLRIVRALQALGEIVAMTGDGVNDAPALKQADIGVSMGQRGTDVAKAASDLVLLDDNFTTIVRAIGEGRRQFDNIRKFVRYLLSSNAGEVIAILVNIMIGGPLIFAATQILWMNLVTDGVTAVALGLERRESGQMQEPPRQKSEPVLGSAGLAMIVLFGSYTGAASLWIFYTTLPFGMEAARTTAFCAMVVFEKVSVFAFRSLRQPCWRIGWFTNPLLLLALLATFSAQLAAVYWPPLQALLHTVPLEADRWLMIAVLSLPLVAIPELVKSIGWLPKASNSA